MTPSVRPINMFLYGGPLGVTVRLEGGTPEAPVKISAVTAVAPAQADANNVWAPFPAVPAGFQFANVFIDDPDSQFYGIPAVDLGTGPHQIIVGAYPIPMPPPFNIQLPPLVPKFPAAPTREQVCGVRLTFQGLTVDTEQYGTLPWFEPAISWLDRPADRQKVYAAKRAKGDRSLLVGIPCGDPLYNEYDNPYNPNVFGPRDWSNGETQMNQQFIDLVREVIVAGFTPVLLMDERFEHSMTQARIVIEALKSGPIDLTDYCLIGPGYDGIFYGWDPTLIMQWAAAARAAGAKYLVLEHNSGHIPLGEGGFDYMPGGKMSDFDVVMSEFDDDGGPAGGNATIWQIVGRLVTPYHRPADQQGDFGAPFYLHDSPRGPRYYCAFEFGGQWGVYGWVRGKCSAEQIDQRRQYLRALGCEYTG